MERRDSTKDARRCLDKALRVNKVPFTPEQYIAMAQAYTEIARVEEYHRRTLLQAEAAGLDRSPHVTH